ncbi:MAG: hypothetical protein LBQ52_04960 [Helicobacteraceae bacterium]|jgi:hypothetical protein|nr:hypothetical protein [Helicobacteraceae bacterium]
MLRQLFLDRETLSVWQNERRDNQPQIESDDLLLQTIDVSDSSEFDVEGIWKKVADNRDKVRKILSSNISDAERILLISGIIGLSGFAPIIAQAPHKINAVASELQDGDLQDSEPVEPTADIRQELMLDEEYIPNYTTDETDAFDEFIDYAVVTGMFSDDDSQNVYGQDFDLGTY